MGRAIAEVLSILLIAEEAAGVKALELLRESSHRVVAVVTDGSGREQGRSRVAELAARLRHRVWPTERIAEPRFSRLVQEEKVDLLLNIHALHVLPRDLVEAPRIGSFNLHPGPLPQYAGLNAPSWAIYHGERTHGVTLHWMDGDIDTGPIGYQAMFDVNEEDTGLSLSVKCVRAGIPLLRRLLQDAAADPAAVPRLPQVGQRRRYYRRQVPHQGWLTWNAPAARVVNFVRACDYLPFASPWGHPRSLLRGREVQVLKAARTGEAAVHPPGFVGERVDGGVLVACGDEWIVVRSIRLGEDDIAASAVLRVGDRFAWPLVA
jgi:methionyl-tRNA formyltransferase